MNQSSPLDLLAFLWPWRLRFADLSNHQPKTKPELTPNPAASRTKDSEVVALCNNAELIVGSGVGALVGSELGKAVGNRVGGRGGGRNGGVGAEVVERIVGTSDGGGVGLAEGVGVGT